jgi:hypothetical protein
MLYWYNWFSWWWARGWSKRVENWNKYIEKNFLSDLHTKRSPTQSDIYQRLYWYNWFSWWWTRGCSKHLENWNKYIEKNFLSDLHTKRSTTQSDIYQRLYWYNWFSWWWARGCSKHVDNWNKYIEKNCASSWSITKNHNKMHGQQNIKFYCCPFFKKNGVCVCEHISVKVPKTKFH